MIFTCTDTAGTASSAAFTSTESTWTTWGAPVAAPPASTSLRVAPDREVYDDERGWVPVEQRVA